MSKYRLSLALRLARPLGPESAQVSNLVVKEAPCGNLRARGIS